MLTTSVLAHFPATDVCGAKQISKIKVKTIEACGLPLFCIQQSHTLQPHTLLHTAVNMSRQINQPSNQIKLTNVSLVRLKKGKKRFELACVSHHPIFCPGTINCA